MLKGLLNAVKWGAIGLATGQLVSGYNKDKTFKSKIDKAQGFAKVKEAVSYLVATNKKLIDETNLDGVIENVKETATQAQKQIKSIKKDDVVENLEKAQLKFNDVKDQISAKAKKTVEDAMILLQKKMGIIEQELEDFEENAKTYAEDTWTEYYRQLASKFALFKKTATKYIVDGALAAEEKFDIETKIKFIAGRLEQLKKNQSNS